MKLRPAGKLQSAVQVRQDLRLTRQRVTRLFIVGSRQRYRHINAEQMLGEDGEPFAFVAVTMPPWPGMDEAVAAEGPWAPTVPPGS